MRIRTRLVVILLTFSVLPAVFIGLLLFENAGERAKAGALENIRTISEVKEAIVLEFLSAKRGRTIDFSTDGFIRLSVREMERMATGQEKTRAGERLGEYLRTNKQVVDADIIEIHVLDISGTVVASTDRAFIGADESGEDYFRKGMAGSVVQGISEHEHGGMSHRFIPVAAPLVLEGRTIGVIMNGYSIELAEDIMSGKRSLDLGAASTVALGELEGIDIYMVDSEGLLLTRSKKMPGAGLLELRVATRPVASCLEAGAEESGEWADMTGMLVWGASQCLRISEGAPWTLVVEQDEAAALAPLRSEGQVVVFITVFVAVVAGFTSYAVALSITRPIDKLRKGARIISTGNLDYRVATDGKDELGELSRDFDRMAEALKSVTASRDELDREARERKKAIDALRLSETKYRNLVEGSLAGILRANLKGELVFVNEALAKIFEFDSPSDMVREGSRPRFRDEGQLDRILDALRAAGRIEAVEVEVVTRRGSPRTVLVNAGVLKDVITGTVLDITELKRAAEVRREAERSRRLAEISDALANVVTDYQGLLDTVARYIGELTKAPCVIRLLTEDGEWLEPASLYHPDPALTDQMRGFIEANPQPADGAVGQRLLSAGRQFSFDLPEEVRKAVRTESAPMMERLGIMSALVTPLRSEGRTIGLITCFGHALKGRFTPEERLLIQDLADRSALAITIARLFTSLKKELDLRMKAESSLKTYAAELERSNADLEQFAYVASHDLREPLRSIEGFLKLLSRRYSGRLDENADRFIAFAVAGAVRMHRIIDDLLEYSRVSTRAGRLEPTDATAVVGQVIENLTAAIADSGAVVSAGRLPVVSADEAQLTQVFQNLIANAIKFRAPGRAPEVRIIAVEKEDEWVFSVADNGIGFDPRHKEKVFEMFQRLHGAEYEGTGIGLAVCKKIVERHGGRIWVETAPGEGSVFSFTILKRV